MTRKTRSLSLTEVQRAQVENEYEAVFLTAGAQPVSGYADGLVFLAEELQRGAASMNGQPVNINHSRAVEDEVGFVKPDSVRVVDGKLRGTIVLNPSTAKFAVAKAFIENRQRANKAPEVSVGVTYLEEMLGNGTVLARDIAFDHLALVTRGACSPERGCGVGLSKETTLMEPENPTPEAGAVPAAPAPEAAPAEAPAPAPAPEAAPAPVAAEAAKPPCGCHELEAALLAEKETVKKLTALHAATLAQVEGAAKTNEALLASIPQRLALLQEARDLGFADMTGAEDITLLSARVADGKRVAAHLAARATAAVASPATGPTAAPTPAPAPTRAAQLAQDDVGKRAAALLAAGARRD